jgi:hypothetical protein
MARDGWVQVGAYLRPHEAELLRGVLESEGIPVEVEDVAISALNELLQSAVGGAKLLVPAGEAERAAGILAATGVPAPFDGEAGEIPEEEWSRGSPEDLPATRPVTGPGEGSGPERAAAHALRASFAALALAATIVVPLYALNASLRALRTPGAPSRSARVQRAWALAVSMLALVTGLAVWSVVFPRVRERIDTTEQREGLPRPVPPNPARP